jgi:RNA polymerase sigma-70 factor (ECF subfamily)
MQEAEFEGFCRNNYDMVVRFAYLVVGDEQEALDVAQETFARAFERWRQVRQMANPAGWVHRVALNLAISNTRRRGKARNPGSGHVPEPDVTDPALLAALRALPPAQRAAVVVRYYLDLSVEDAAQVLGKRPGTVRALTSQGIARLRDLLGGSWMEVRDDRAGEGSSDPPRRVDRAPST